MHFVNSVSVIVNSLKSTCQASPRLNNAQLSNTDSQTNSKFSFSAVTAAKVKSIISSLPRTGSTGSDGISVDMLKYSVDDITQVIAKLLNMSVQSNKCPSHRETAYITSVYKKGNEVDMKNYRLISILLCLSKVFERVLDEQLRVYVESNCLLSKIQHGFRKGHPCQYALISLSNTLFANRSKGLVTAVATLDFSKAFDTLYHDV